MFYWNKIIKNEWVFYYFKCIKKEKSVQKTTNSVSHSWNLLIFIGKKDTIFFLMMPTIWKCGVVFHTYRK